MMAGSKMVYEWGSRSYPVSPEVVGNTVEKIARKQGRCEPDALVQIARPEDHPLHTLFTWDNDSAADKWRTHEARRVINSLVVTVKVGDHDVTAPAFLSVGHTVKTQEAGEGYRSVAVVMGEPAFAEEAAAEVLAKLRTMRQKYAALEALSPVWAALDQIAA